MVFWLAVLVSVLLTLWATAALGLDLPSPSWRVPAAIAYLAAVSTVFVLLNGDWRGWLAAGGAVVAVLTWWLSLKPSTQRDWRPDVAETPWAEINGNLVTIHNLRNCDYRGQFDYTPRWETRTVDLAKLRGI